MVPTPSDGSRVRSDWPEANSLCFSFRNVFMKMQRINVTQSGGLEFQRRSRESLPDGGVWGARDDHPLIVLQTQDRACVACENPLAFQCAFIPDLGWQRDPFDHCHNGVLWRLVVLYMCDPQTSKPREGEPAFFPPGRAKLLDVLTSVLMLTLSFSSRWKSSL